MPPAVKKSASNFLQFALIFAVVYLGSQFVLNQFFPGLSGNAPVVRGVQVKMVSSSVSLGNTPEVIVENKQGASGSVVLLPGRCPQPPLDAFAVAEPGTSQEKLTPLSATGAVVGCDKVVKDAFLTPGKSARLTLAPWKSTFFSATGTYELRLPREAPGSASSKQLSGSILTVRFTVVEPNAFVKVFRTFITAPFLNALVFIASVVPGHNLGIAIILLTLIVKLLLFIPTQHAMEGQKKMQMLQPKIEALKKQYPDDAKKVQEETMKLWAEHKINPFSSCLPTLIQFPILIGLFYVIRDGSHLEASAHLLYPMYRHIEWTFGTNFLGLDLLQPNWYVLPPLLVIMQFLQMKLAFAIQKRKTKKDIIDVPAKDGKEEKQPMDSQKMQQTLMLYGLPLMIGVFAFQFPAAVAVYWGISTLFGIGQQLLVNREHLRV